MPKTITMYDESLDSQHIINKSSSSAYGINGLVVYKTHIDEEFLFKFKDGSIIHMQEGYIVFVTMNNKKIYFGPDIPDDPRL